VEVEGAVDFARAIVSFSPVDGASAGAIFATEPKVRRLFNFCVKQPRPLRILFQIAATTTLATLRS
jgi:hypothetical protein